MIIVILIILSLFWFLGYLGPLVLFSPPFPLFYFNGRPVTVWDIFIFILILWVTGLLPSPFRQITSLLLLLWLLSSLGILVMTGLSAILVMVVIIAVALSLVKN